MENYSKPKALTLAKLQEIQRSIKPLPTKRQVLQEFMEANEKHWFWHWLLLPEDIRVLLDNFPGDMPEFAKFTPHLDNQVLIMQHNAGAQAPSEAR